MILSAVPVSAAQSEFPAFLAGVISSLENESAATSPEEIWSYFFDNKNVYYVAPRYCCDLPSTLYDASGNVLCYPDGGIAGVGDGRCPTFFENRSNGVRIWRHPGLDQDK